MNYCNCVNEKTREKINMVLSEIAKIEEVNEDTVFKKDELDSFDKMNLLVMLEEISNQAVSIVDLMECKTVGDIYLICEGKSGGVV